MDHTPGERGHYDHDSRSDYDHHGRSDYHDNDPCADYYHDHDRADNDHDHDRSNHYHDNDRADYYHDYDHDRSDNYHHDNLFDHFDFDHFDHDSAAVMRVDCHLCTFGRFETVRRSLAQFLAQDYEKKTLLIFNTAPTPITIDPKLHGKGIRVVNQSINPDGTPFTSLGQVRSAAMNHAEGDSWICWDDDDLFLPYHIETAVTRLQAAGSFAWKPLRSLFSGDGGKTFKFAQNAMEASILCDLNFVQEHGFSTTKSGGEHVFGGWLDRLKKEDQLTIEDVTPSYAYVWGDGLSKTSGNIDNPDNFENHKKASQDFGDGFPLSPVPIEDLLPMMSRAKEFALGGKVAA